MSKNKEEEVEEETGPEISEIERKMAKIYEATIKNSEIRSVITNTIESRTQKVKSRIIDDVDLFTHSTEEADLKPLIRKWRGTFMKGEIKNFAMNHLYFTDTTMVKKDLQRNLKLLDDNIDAMGTTDGFQKIEKQIGLNDKLLQKSSTVNALKPMKDIELLSGARVSYNDKKKQLDDEHNAKIADANDLMEKLKQGKERLRAIRVKRKATKNKSEEATLGKMEEDEEQKKQDIEKKHAELLEKINNIKVERQKKIDEMIENTKKIEKPRYKKLEKDFKRNILMPNLEEKKQALASIRNLYKPIRLDEIKEHKNKMDEIIEEKKREWEQNAPKDDFTYKKYETNWINSIKEQESQQKELQERKDGEKKEMYDKMRSYGEMVKEMHKPAVSKKKQLEMQLLKESIRHPIRNRLQGSSLMSQNHGNRRSTDSLLGIGNPAAQSDREDAHSNTIKRRKIIWKDNPMVPKLATKRESHAVDWLQEKRKERAEDAAEGIEHKSNPIKDWQKEISDSRLNQQEKYEFIKERTKQLEEDAKRKEEMITLAKAGTVQDRDQINDMIFESIKAKLNILEEFNS
jgi:hypothetical protein